MPPAYRLVGWVLNPFIALDHGVDEIDQPLDEVAFGRLDDPLLLADVEKCLDLPFRGFVVGLGGVAVVLRCRAHQR